MYKIAGLAVIFLFISSSIFAQVNVGTIEGVAADRNGAIIPGAVIKATLQTEKSISARYSTTVTNAEGKFEFSKLPFGIYEIEINWVGRITKKLVEIKAGEKNKQFVELQIPSGECSDDDAKSSSGSVTDEDKAEIVRQMLENALKVHSTLLAQGKIKSGDIILSDENINTKWLSNQLKQKFILIEESDISLKAETKGEFNYLAFSELKTKGMCVEVSLDNFSAVGRFSTANSLGGSTYKFLKLDGIWIGIYIIAWIS